MSTKQNTLKSYNANLLKNTYKKQDNHPDFQSVNLEIEGNPYKIAVWKKVDKNGNEYLSLNFGEDTYKKNLANNEQKNNASLNEESNEDNPFDF